LSGAQPGVVEPNRAKPSFRHQVGRLPFLVCDHREDTPERAIQQRAVAED